jgi:hypothetical protein
MIMSSNRKKVFIVSSILGVAVIAIFSLVPMLMNLSSTAEANSLSMVLLISREDGPRVPSPGPVTTISAQSLINLPEMQNWAQMADAKRQTMPPPCQSNCANNTMPPSLSQDPVYRTIISADEVNKLLASLPFHHIPQTGTFNVWHEIEVQVNGKYYSIGIEPLNQH